MKEFEQVYKELIKKYEGNGGEAFAREIYEAGRNVSFTQNLKDAVKNDKIAINLMSFTAMTMAESSVKMNVADLAFSTELTINDKRYFTRLSSITFESDKKSLEERALEIAKNILNSTVVYNLEDVLTKAILVGYNLRNEDFSN